MVSLEFEKRKRSALNLDMTPLIDMVFLLLIFFVLSSQFISHKGFKVKLPKAAHAQIQKSEAVTVMINEKGKVLLAGQEVPLGDLKGAVLSAFKESESKSVAIRADEKVPLGLAVKVMDIAREADADGLVISAQDLDRESGN